MFQVLVSHLICSSTTEAGGAATAAALILSSSTATARVFIWAATSSTQSGRTVSSQVRDPAQMHAQDPTELLSDQAIDDEIDGGIESEQHVGDRVDP